MANSKYHKLCLPNLETITEHRAAGASFDDIAEFLGVRKQTIVNWKKQHPEFAAALEEGDAQMGENIEWTAAHSLIDKLKDRMVLTEQIIEDGVIIKEKRQLIKADTTAIIFALKARNPQVWDPLGVARVKELEKNEDVNKQILDTLQNYSPDNFASDKIKKIS